MGFTTQLNELNKTGFYSTHLAVVRIISNQMAGICFFSVSPLAKCFLSLDYLLLNCAIKALYPCQDPLGFTSKAVETSRSSEMILIPSPSPSKPVGEPIM